MEQKNTCEEIIQPDIIEEGSILKQPKDDICTTCGAPVTNTADYALQEAVNRNKTLNLHPFSGLTILFLDYAFWVAELPVISIIPAIVIAFFVSLTGVFLIQRYIEEEDTGRSLAKAFFGAVITAVPTPFFGTAFATLILSISGLNFLGKKLHSK